MVMSSEERARREPWGNMEEAVMDATRMMQRACEGLPEGQSKDEIRGWLRDAENSLDPVVIIAQQVAHRQREP